ncbi:NAD(P)-binding protein [Sphingomonas sp.]|uniref:NAD(P)-binding protein n=1 Tax=Sphingomonas sp. TaxID=28214 RepID=UPI002DD66354|nr:NAD(P)-binding protein [Sphingomonas sp.]
MAASCGRPENRENDMNTRKRILISGGGIAGPACAYWLDRHGFSVVIVEKAASLRSGGQNVDVKGAGQQVIREMGLNHITNMPVEDGRGLRRVKSPS